MGLSTYHACGPSQLLPKLAYFKDFEAGPSSLRFRLVIRIQNSNFHDCTLERFLEADVVFHRVPNALIGTRMAVADV